jgi:HAD superfamily hydrolase (TIGR01549 family)
VQNLNGIRAIFFDLDGTLRVSQPSGSDVFVEYAIQLGIPITVETRKLAARWEHAYFAMSPEIQQDDLDYPDEAQFWLNFARRRLIALSVSPAEAQELAPQFNEYMRENYHSVSQVPDDGVWMLNELKAAGYPLAVISNRGAPFDEELEQLGIRHYFDYTLAAGEVGSFKPQAGVFAHALEQVGVQGKETLYVGDNYYADIVGARNAGLQALLYDPAGVFDEPDCPVIRSYREFPMLANRDRVER